MLHVHSIELYKCTCILKGFGGIMVSMLTSSVVDDGFLNPVIQTRNYEIGICCFSAKYSALRSKSKD